jgi:Spy/CpxP family protein refolding chaperone
MNRTRTAIFGMFLMGSLSAIAAAQGGGGGGGGGGGAPGRGRGGPPPIASYNQLFANIRVSQDQQAKISAIGNAYTDSLNVVAPARGAGPGGAGGPPGGGPPPAFSALPDSVQKKALALVDARNKAMAAVLTPAQKKEFDAAVAADAKLRGTPPGGGH